jgi:hypothetical protein
MAVPIKTKIPEGAQFHNLSADRNPSKPGFVLGTSGIAAKLDRPRRRQDQMRAKVLTDPIVAKLPIQTANDCRLLDQSLAAPHRSPAGCSWRAERVINGDD